ncbi:preprotein translocase subunit Sec61beta [Candidatus Micrarchaeota archaeon]|nr:preprotein translocase subunit Sec61beta [Candidatus Micrarchaeota archaeon]MBI5177271.1 preprotein translocase subunit Sec61beta [Candidatus Micrarchaeota archaeon]
MAENRITTPSSSTGITRFYDVDSSSIELDPRIIVGFAVAVIVFELVLHAVSL